LILNSLGKPVKNTFVQAPISVDEIIARRRLSLKRKRNQEDGESDSENEDEESSVGDESEAEISSEGNARDEDEEEESDEEVLDMDELGEASDDPLASSGEDEENSEDENPDDASENDADSDSSEDEEEEETEADKARKAAFFAAEEGTSEAHDSFLSMNLSRPLLKAITSMGFQKPTPIQSATIPVALLGKDVVGNAVTGSGKTAAFMIPMLERLLYRDKGKKAAATRCLVLLPTRELAVQCYEVGKKLASHTDVQLCLLVGQWYQTSIYLCYSQTR
jgi:ATP-dependent RNA helicase DDX27